FYPLPIDAHDVTIRDLTVNATVADTLGFVGVYTRNLTLENVRTNSELAVWFTKGANVRGCQCAFDGNGLVTAEFAGCVDLSVTGNTFGYVGTSARSSAVLIDIGSGWFSFVDNDLENAGNIMLQVNWGVHDGSIVGNRFGYTTNVDIGGSIAINAT